MNTKYYVAMAVTVGEYVQSDLLYLIRLGDGRLIGYSEEFEYCTCDIAEACSLEQHHLAKWFGWPKNDTDWVPATLDQIKSLKLENILIGSKADMTGNTPIEPVSA